MASIRNGILAPKGWKFRDINGKDISDERAFKARFNFPNQQPQQEAITKTIEQPINTKKILGSETKINIYAGTGENADLSNFAKRPVSVNDISPQRTPFDAHLGQFNTVEGAFQAQKLYYSTMPETEKERIADKLRESSGAEARKIGRSITGLNTKAWDENSSKTMKAIIKASFEQNPQALQRLLATGNATLTHTQDKGKWGTEFPKLLMEVRDELREQQQETIIEQPIDTHQESIPVNTTLEQQMKQEWTPQIVQFRTLRIVSEFKKCVDNLERKLDASEQLATQSATRQYLITTKYGTSKILGKVKDSITKTYANLDWVTNFVHDLYEEEDWNTKEVVDKINHIYEQGQLMLKYFEPLCFEASMYIKNMEGVSLLTNDGELIEVDDETTVDEEDFTKHEEGWFYDAHEQSVESMLSDETKSILQNLYETDEYGEPVQYDDLEQALTLDYRMVLGTILQLIGKCTSNSQMIPAIVPFSW